MSDFEEIQVDVELPAGAVPLLHVVVYAFPGQNHIGVTGGPAPALERLDREDTLKVAPVVVRALRSYADGVDSEVDLEHAVDAIFTGEPS